MNARLLPLAIYSALAAAVPAQCDVFTQINLVSDISGLAPNTDANLKNPWGVSFAGGSPFWVSDQKTGVSTLYSAAGVPNGLVVSVPGGPTGQVSNATSGFVENDGQSALFIFSTLSGSIYAWNNAQSNTSAAELKASSPGNAFTGLAMSGGNLYAASPTGSGAIFKFASDFSAQTLPGGQFVDPNLPAGFVPYNIQSIGGIFFVAYEGSTTSTRSFGFVSEFDAGGTFIRQLSAPGGILNTPWGVVIAPPGFGSFANDILVGNLGNGEINAFDPATGAFIGTLDGVNGQPLINSGLWSLSTRTGGAFNSSAVYFTAGLNGQQDGLLGAITLAPEPGSLALAALGVIALVARRLNRP